MEFTMLYSNDQVYIVGGVDVERRVSNRVMVFTEEFGLDSCPSMEAGRCRPAVAILDGWIYVICGQGEAETLASAEALDIENEQWKQLPDSPNARASASACAVAKNVYVMGGGSQEYDFILHIDVYETKYEGWNTLFLKLRYGIINPLAFAIPKRNGILIFGGFTPENECKKVQLLNLSDMTWRDWHDLPVVMSDHWNFPVIFEPEREFLHLFNSSSQHYVQHVYYSVADILAHLVSTDPKHYRISEPRNSSVSPLKISKRIGG
jgi:hypothetical protein